MCCIELRLTLSIHGDNRVSPTPPRAPATRPMLGGSLAFLARRWAPQRGGGDTDRRPMPVIRALKSGLTCRGEGVVWNGVGRGGVGRASSLSVSCIVGAVMRCCRVSGMAIVRGGGLRLPALGRKGGCGCCWGLAGEGVTLAEAVGRKGPWTRRPSASLVGLAVTLRRYSSHAPSPCSAKRRSKLGWLPIVSSSTGGSSPPPKLCLG